MGFSVKNLTALTKSFVKSAGKKSVLQTKPTIFHGINPTLTYPKSGESFALPRYISEEMREARKMNDLSAILSKTELNLTFPKALPDDLRRLTSNTLNDSYSRCLYIRPDDGEIFNLLKTGETKDGKFVMRILDTDGAFIKEAQVKPKIHVLIDDLKEKAFSRKDNGWRFEELYKLTHGEYMKIGAQKTNPFEKVIIYDVSTPCKNGKINPERRNLEIYKELEKKIKNGENIDIISQSRGATGIAHDLEYKLNGEEFQNLISNLSFSKLVKTANQKGIRVLNSAGNEGKKSLNRNLLNSGAEGVGAIGGNGKIAEYSASRNTIWTQHYERSCFPVVAGDEGLNITGTSGIDLMLKSGVPFVSFGEIGGTSLATATRAAKINLNETMKEIL